MVNVELVCVRDCNHSPLLVQNPETELTHLMRVHAKRQPSVAHLWV
jgi:hypothetical protein